MPHQPALTFAGALAVLGVHEPKTVGRLDKALGGLILAAGVGAGLAAVGGAALAPLALLASLWNWVDQKNEAMGLLRSIIGGIGSRSVDTTGRERRELIVAAHSTIATAAFLDVLRGRLTEVDLTADLLLTPGDNKTYFDALYLLEIPCPSGVWGFRENLTRVEDWANTLLLRAEQQLRAMGTGIPSLLGFPSAVAARYESYYLDLAVKVPEFLVWASLGESAATRLRLAALDDFMRAEHATALARVEHLLSTHARQTRPTDLQQRLHRANRGVLDEPVVPSGAERYDTEVVFPAVGKVFLTPRYRIVRGGKSSRLADDRWWDNFRARDDLDHVIVGHLISPDAIRVPLVLLGHPGAGKSLFTKVLAARLPMTDYTVVRVSLRAVDSGAPIMAQLQHALDQATNERVPWTELADRSAETVRVLLLDGLDELLQASRHDRGNYLQEVTEFQRVEAQQGRPVVAVVTCRTVVIDRVVVADDTVVVKLEEFDHDQVREWLRCWHDTNRDAVTASEVRALTFDEAMHQPDLATQPLLLLMLALYAADPASPALDAGLSRAALYERIFDNFARREVQKRAKHLLRGTALEAAVNEQTTRLAVAGLAMFNRGRQSARESEIRADLAALSRQPESAEDLGARVLGEFFFVHTAEATSAERKDRSYEFLHATFGEYLVAHHVILELRRVADAAFGGRWPTGDVADELLFALLSHHAWLRRRSIVDFAVSIFRAIPKDERDRVVLVLHELIRTYRAKERSPRFDTYAPVPRDAVRRLAAYSVNLITMAVFFASPEPVPLHELFGGTSDEAIRVWRSTLSLWLSGLYGNSWHAVAETLNFADGAVGARGQRIDGIAAYDGAAEVFYARLTGDQPQTRRLQYGIAIADGTTIFDTASDWEQYMLSFILATNHFHPHNNVLPIPNTDVPAESVERIGRLLEQTLRARVRDSDQSWCQWVVDSLLRFPQPYQVEARTVLAVVYFEPAIFARTGALHDPEHFVGVRAESAFAFDHPHGNVGNPSSWRFLRKWSLGDYPPSEPTLEEIGRIIQVFT